jgi:hypothetical protein
VHSFWPGAIVAFSRFQIRMNARREALRLGHPLQERDELRALWRVEGRQQLDVALVGCALELGKQVAPSGRQVERVSAPVDGIAAALGELALLEVVDERDHRAAVDPERVAERLLGLALGGGEVAEHSEVPWVEVESREVFGKLPMRVGAELGQQKAGAPAQAPRRGRLRAGRFSGHLADSTAPAELFLL